MNIQVASGNQTRPENPPMDHLPSRKTSIFHGDFPFVFPISYDFPIVYRDISQDCPHFPSIFPYFSEKKTSQAGRIRAAGCVPGILEEAHRWRVEASVLENA